MEYGLIGEKLGHSFSKIIHEDLADYTYDLHSIAKENLDAFMKQKAFKAINVTIPYKVDVISYLDEIDQKAKAVGAVNTIVNRENKLYGYNTDFDGFLYLLEKNKITIKNKKILVLGKGGASKAVIAVLNHLKAKKIITVYYKESHESVTYEQAKQLHSDADIIINTTPVGMYPNIDDSPIDLKPYTQCKFVIDIIYNPIKTKFLLEGEKYGMTAIGGLEMLIAQAKYAVEIFLDIAIPEQKIDILYKKMLLQKGNVVLIGMPSCGKTTIAKQLSPQLQKEFIDIDEQIVSKINMPISDYFEKYGEEAFRDIEETVIKEISMKNNLVISTGGGCVKRERNMIRLAMNGSIIFIQRDLSKLIIGEGRPLSCSSQALQQMYQQRLPLYHRYSHRTIENNTSTEKAVESVKFAYWDILK